MFIYNLYTHTAEGQDPLPGIQLSRNADPLDAIQQSGDAVIMVWPYADADTFDFETQGSRAEDIVLVKGKGADGKTVTKRTTAPIKLTENPLYLDTYVTQLNVRQNKEDHQGSLNMSLLDPTDSILSNISPGDHMVCWMFDNHKDAQALRAVLKSGSYGSLNGFSSGLKFLGKVFSVRKNITVSNTGAKARRFQILATSFSELDSNIYFDPQLATNFFKGTEFMQAIARQLNSISGVPQDINKMLAQSLAVFMGVGLKTPGNNGSIAQMSRPLKIPDFVAKILGVQGSHYIDILRTHIGIEKYNFTKYLPDLGDSANVPNGPSTRSPYKTIKYTPVGLVGWNSIQVAPFNNVPMWSILYQFSNPNINEMFTTLKMNDKGEIGPTLTIRQIPFNNEAFLDARPNIKGTAFRTLPRWKVTDEIINNYSVGKSESLRINFVRVSAVPEAKNGADVAGIRARVDPASDIVDIERNGLRGYVTAINSILNPVAAEVSTRQWTAVVTDRYMGSHLKLSGTIGLAGVQEPIAVGDNLLYDNLIFHIEQVEHSLTVESMTGRKSFSTNLAISNGVPATGSVLPEIGNRGTKLGEFQGLTGPSQTVRATTTANLPNNVASNAKKDDD
jgi:hypothetical protein